MAATGRTPITADTLESHFARELRSLAGSLAEVARDMRDSGIETIEVMNQPAAEDALVKFENLLSSCTSNFSKAKKEMAKQKLKAKP